MNQPSAENILDTICNGAPTFIEGAKLILDRYHLIDKSEPIPGAVSADALLDIYTVCQNSGLFVSSILNRFDIFPKGTVARLTEAVNFWKDEERKAQAEVDRLTDELEIMRGCDKDNESLADDLFRLEANHESLRLKWIDEVAKREALEAEVDRLNKDGWKDWETPDSSKRVQLPEVPMASMSMNEWIRRVDKFMQAVKAWAEGKE